MFIQRITNGYPPGADSVQRAARQVEKKIHTHKKPERSLEKHGAFFSKQGGWMRTPRARITCLVLYTVGVIGRG